MCYNQNICLCIFDTNINLAKFFSILIILVSVLLQFGSPWYNFWNTFDEHANVLRSTSWFHSIASCVNRVGFFRTLICAHCVFSYVHVPDADSSLSQRRNNSNICHKQCVHSSLIYLTMNSEFFADRGTRGRLGTLRRFWEPIYVVDASSLEEMRKFC